jgi:hypothetical protein
MIGLGYWLGRFQECRKIRIGEKNHLGYIPEVLVIAGSMLCNKNCMGPRCRQIGTCRCLEFGLCVIF